MAPSTRSAARSDAERSATAPKPPKRGSGHAGGVEVTTAVNGTSTLVSLSGFGAGRHEAAVRLSTIVDGPDGRRNRNAVAGGEQGATAVWDGDLHEVRYPGICDTYVVRVDGVEHRGERRGMETVRAEQVLVAADAATGGETLREVSAEEAARISVDERDATQREQDRVAGVRDIDVVDGNEVSAVERAEAERRAATDLTVDERGEYADAVRESRGDVTDEDVPPSL